VPIAVAGHAFHLVPRTRDMEVKDALLRDAALYCNVLSRTEPGERCRESIVVGIDNAAGCSRSLMQGSEWEVVSGQYSHDQSKQKRVLEWFCGK
jgi:hypothetical protein